MPNNETKLAQKSMEYNFRMKKKSQIGKIAF